MNRSARRVAALVTVGTATWAAAMATGQLIVLATGVPASSALLTGFLVPFLLVLGARAVRHPASVTISFTVYGALAIPTLLLGPPGLQKLPVALLAGLSADLVIWLAGGRWPRAAYAVAFCLWGALLAALARLLYELLPLPGKERFVELFWALTAVFVVEALIGAVMASWVFDRRKLGEHPLVVRLQDEPPGAPPAAGV